MEPRNNSLFAVNLRRFRLRRASVLSISLLLVLMGGLPAQAFDQVVHHALVYAIAIANGFNQKDAAIIANASYSLDANNTTTAFSFGLLKNELANAGSDRLSNIQAIKNVSSSVTIKAGDLKSEATDVWNTGPSELPHINSGQLFHALTSVENRKFIEQHHIDRLNKLLKENQVNGTPEQKHNLELLYFGEYLHFAADMVVHPPEPVFGHLFSGTDPDRADLNPKKVQAAVALLNEKMKEFKTDGLQQTIPEQLSLPEKMDDDAKKNEILYKISKAASDSFKEEMNAHPRFEKRLFVYGPMESVDGFGSDHEQWRYFEAAQAISEILRQNSDALDTLKKEDKKKEIWRVPGFRPFHLDADGNPLWPDTAIFSQPVRNIEELPFGAILDTDSLGKERHLSYYLGNLLKCALTSNNSIIQPDLQEYITFVHVNDENLTFYTVPDSLAESDRQILSDERGMLERDYNSYLKNKREFVATYNNQLLDPQARRVADGKKQQLMHEALILINRECSFNLKILAVEINQKFAESKASASEDSYSLKKAINLERDSVVSRRDEIEKKWNGLIHLGSQVTPAELQQTDRELIEANRRIGELDIMEFAAMGTRAFVPVSHPSRGL